MLKKFFLIVTAILLLPIKIISQNGVSGETEIGSDGLGGSFVSQYIFADSDKTNLLTRYFWVNNIENRGEFAAGPTFKSGQQIIKMQFGGTTAKQVMTAGVAVLKITDRTVIYIGDLKIGFGSGISSFYQKLFVPVTKDAIWQVRMEDLIVVGNHAFLRIGAEWQGRFSPKSHLYIAPFYDTVSNHIGGQIGYRFSP